MPQFNPLTNAVGGNGATTPNVYYNNAPTNFGEYQYIYLSEIVDNFIATYVGEGKILERASKGDVNFHAHRALQELHYDVLKSCKSLEIEVCPSLKMPLPHDYVNYVKITSVDSKGIEHIIYPTRHTSNPFAIEQDDCAYTFNDDGTIKHQETCEAGTEVTCSPDDAEAWLEYGANQWRGTSYPETVTILGVDYTFNNAMDFYNTLFGHIDAYCICVNSVPNSPITCGNPSETGWGIKTGGAITWGWDGGNITDAQFWQTHPNDGSWIPYQQGQGSTLMDYLWPTVTGTTNETCELTSNAWDSWSTSSGSNTSAIPTSSTQSIDTDIYATNAGRRFGLQPEHAQTNGSFFIDCLRGNIHFSSNLSGQTIILHYLSDGHGTEDEQIVHKFAEEAMYKWIAYGCLSSLVDIPEYVVQRYKKEKFAETRKAKIRLSNIKIEEISQIMRNKSKWIKH